jgi:hypothetical protein
MRDGVFETINAMPRDELETFAMRATQQLHINRGEIQAANLFLSMLVAFLTGAIVAASGLLLGFGLG